MAFTITRVVEATAPKTGSAHSMLAAAVAVSSSNPPVTRPSSSSDNSPLLVNISVFILRLLFLFPDGTIASVSSTMTDQQ
jgi:hypothetical protein